MSKCFSKIQVKEKMGNNNSIIDERNVVKLYQAYSLIEK